MSEEKPGVIAFEEVIVEELRALQDCLVPGNKLVLTQQDCRLYDGNFALAIGSGKVAKLLAMREEKP